MAMQETMNRPAYREVASIDYSTKNFPTAVASSSSTRGSLAEINPNMIATTLAFNRSESRTGSISTVWSSADIPLFLDSKMERRESGSSQHMGPSRIFMSSSRGLTHPGMRSISYQSDFMADQDEREELASDAIDGPQSVSSPPGSESGELPPRESIRINRPPPLNLAPFPAPRLQSSSSSSRNDTPTTGVPSSVSYSSNLTMMTGKSQTPTYPSSSSATASASAAPVPPPSPRAHLYHESERFFSSSYSMASPTVSQPNTPAHVNNNESALGLKDQTSRFSDEESESSPVKALSPSYSYSRGSRSSADSFVLPDPDDSNQHHPFALPSAAFHSSKMIKSLSNDGISTSPLRVAVGLSSTTMSRPYTSDATTKIAMSNTLFTVPLLPQQMIDGKLIETRHRKYQFLSSAPSLPSKKNLSFGSKLRAVSTPKLRAEKSNEISHGSISPAIGTRLPGDTNRSYPPRAPSTRYRSSTLGESELLDSQDASIHHNQVGQDESIRRVPSMRRPSSSDALSAFSNRLRRPSRATTISSSQYNSSVTSFFNLNQSEEISARMDRTLSNTSVSQSQVEANSVRGTLTQTQKRNQRVSSSHGKNKGGWASHLNQGLTLHIEQGTKKFSLKMNYLSYDPFGKPESLCSSEDRPVTPGRPKSKNGNTEKDSSMEDSVGLLEFGPRNDMDPSITCPSQLTLDAAIDAPIFKHLVIGDDVKGDLITRQANLNMSNIGTREVSGSERRGKVTWRFIYGVEDCRLASGEVISGMKTIRPIGFFCSATLLDPSRAKKSRVMNIIRKQIGSHIESTPMNSSATSSPLQSQQQPMSMNGSVYHSLPVTPTPPPRQITTISQAPNGPSRPNLVPFKMTRPMLEAMAARNRQSSEYSSVVTENTTTTSSMTSTSPREVNSNLTIKSSLLPSPLSSHFPNQKRQSPVVSGKPELPIHRLQPLQQPVTRPRGSSVGRFAAPIHQNGSALELDINEGNHTSRRVRTATSQVELKRPPTASEEIKQAYLLQSSRSDATIPKIVARKPVVY